MKRANARVVDNIKKLIKKQQETAEKLAFGAEVSKSTVSRVLSGKLNPTVRLLEKFADYFEVDIRTFFDP
jgi:transcriptional regulator with XRE-family HTH domain